MINYNLTQGVDLHIIPSEKYKTIKLLVRFIAPLRKDTITKRTLLSSLMETNCLKYPNQTALSEHLAALYGASFGINVSRKGNYHLFNVNMTVVNPSYLSEGVGILNEAVDFLKEIIFAPNTENHHFHEETFQREKENLQEYLLSLSDDKQTYAALKLQELYFDSSKNQGIPSFGTVEDLAEITSESLENYYQQMMQEDQVSIFVLGDVNQEEMVAAFKKWSFSPRANIQRELFYHQEASNVIKERVESEDITQSRLNLAYSTDVYFHDCDYFPLQVFNGIFGGYPHSKLFMNVREKESMAYTASSSFDSFRGLMTVQTGIQAKNRDKVLKLIHQQLLDIQSGLFEEEVISQTKAMLKNQYFLSLDSPTGMIERGSVEKLVPSSKLSPEAWCAEVDLVSREAIQRVAKKIKLQAVFFLEGGGEENAEN